MKTAVEWLCNEWLYIDQEFDMKLIDKKTYWERLKSVQEQANKMFEEQVTLSHINGQSEFDKGAYGEHNEKLANEYYNQNYK